MIDMLAPKIVDIIEVARTIHTNLPGKKAKARVQLPPLMKLKLAANTKTGFLRGNKNQGNLLYNKCSSNP